MITLGPRIFYYIDQIIIVIDMEPLVNGSFKIWLQYKPYSSIRDYIKRQSLAEEVCPLTALHVCYLRTSKHADLFLLKWSAFLKVSLHILHDYMLLVT